MYRATNEIESILFEELTFSQLSEFGFGNLDLEEFHTADSIKDVLENDWIDFAFNLILLAEFEMDLYR